jgi:hypothetical protein
MNPGTLRSFRAGLVVVRLAMVMMVSPIRVRTALVRKMPRCPSTVSEPIAMMRPDTIEPIRRVHVETGRQARPGDHLLEQRQPDAGDAGEGTGVQ